MVDGYALDRASIPLESGILMAARQGSQKRLHQADLDRLDPMLVEAGPASRRPSCRCTWAFFEFVHSAKRRAKRLLSALLEGLLKQAPESI